jgi:Domain of unknown function (DUF4865)
MQAMQYEIALPADYDMAIIRDRVATKGAMTDDFEGLGLKAVDRPGLRARTGERRGGERCDAAHRDDRARRRRRGRDRGSGRCDTRACPRERSPLDRARRRHTRLGARAVHSLGWRGT